MNMSYMVMVVLIRKILSISNGKSRKIKFPNLWIMPILFIGMIMEDYLRPDGYSYVMLMTLSFFGIFGFCLGLIRGIMLKYQEDDNEIYYKESYISLIIYILVIVAKWYLRLIGGVDNTVIGGGLVFFACGSLIGRCSYISYKYLCFNRKRI